VAHTLFHNDEVRAGEEFHADAGLVKPGETELAVKLVEALAAPFEPAKFKDKYRERLKEAIAEKIGTGAVTEAPAGGTAAPVVDIMAALKASLSNARKPVGRENELPDAKKRKAGGRG
jgi:DNA end-binding protein Ku